MSAWVLLTIPGTIVLLMALLSLSAFVEEHLLSPKALLAAALRSRGADPDYAEVFMTRQLEALIRAGDSSEVV